MIWTDKALGCVFQIVARNESDAQAAMYRQAVAMDVRVKVSEKKWRGPEFGDFAPRKVA